MKRPEYKFYIGARISNSSLNLQNKGFIESNGKAHPDADSGGNYWVTQALQHCSGFAGYKHLYFDLDSPGQLFFYDSDDYSLPAMEIIQLRGHAREIITIPEGAQSWMLQFLNTDAAFYAKRESDFVAVMQEITPHYKTLNKKLSKESEQEFFRASLEGDVSIFGDDFDIVNNANIEDLFILSLQKKDDTGAFHEYFRGEFGKTDCTLDAGRRKCKLGISPLDAYTSILDKWENTYDLIKLAPALSKIDLYKRCLMQIYVAGDSVVSNFCGGTYWETSVEAVSSTSTLVGGSHFNRVAVTTEFKLVDTALPAAKKGYAGVYAGRSVQSGGVWSGGYDFQKSLNLPTCKIAKDVNGDYQLSFSDKDGVFATSAQLGGVLDTSTGALNYVGPIIDNNGTTVAQVEDIFNNYVYARILTDSDTYGSTTTYALASDDFAAAGTNYSRCIGAGSSLVNIYATAYTVDGPTRFGKNEDGKYFTDNFLPATAGAGKLFPVGRSSWVRSSTWFRYFTFWQLEDALSRKKFQLRDAWSVGAVIKVLLKEVAPELSFDESPEYSQFLFSANIPFEPMSSRFYVYLAQKTNVLKGEYDQPAQKAETTLKEILDMLCKCFRCYWFIEDDKLRIEHLLYFLNGGSYDTASSGAGINATELVDATNGKPALYLQSEVAYDKSDLADRFEFGWADDCTELFDGFTLDMQSNYVQKDKKEDIVPSSFSSDVDYMLFNPSAFANDGFALLCPQKLLGDTLLDATRISGQAWIDGRLRTGNEFDMQRWAVKPGGRYYVKMSSTPGSKVQYCISVMGKGNRVRTIRNAAVYSDIYGATISTLDGDTYIFVSYSRAVESTVVRPQPGTLQEYTELTLPVVEQNLRDESGYVYEVSIQNYYASWAYLQRFYLYDLPSRRAISNKLSNATVGASRVKKCMAQEVRLSMENDPATIDLITTASGVGSIEEYSVDIDTRVADITLRFSPK